MRPRATSQSGYLQSNLLRRTKAREETELVIVSLRTHSGTLLVARGFEVSQTFMERLRNFGDGILAEKVKVLVPAAKGVTQ